MDHLPVFLNVKGQRALVVGSGTLAARKADLLLRAGCDLTVIKMDFAGESGSMDAYPALQLAADSGAQVISCSWGADIAQAKDMTDHERVLGHLVAWLAHSAAK